MCFDPDLPPSFAAQVGTDFNGGRRRASFLDGATALVFCGPDLETVDGLTDASIRHALYDGGEECEGPSSPPAPIADRVRTLWSGGEDRIGLTADGVSRVLLRTPEFAAAGFVTFWLDDVSDGVESPVGDGGEAWNGFLHDPFTGAIDAAQLTVETLGLEGASTSRGFAVLEAPLDFVRTGHLLDEQRGSFLPRKLRVRWQFQPAGGGAPSEVAEKILELHRPPVLLVHGLFDKGDSWSWASLLDPGIFDVTVADYSASHGRAFLFNVPGVPKGWTQAALRKQRGNGIAATQVDYFGHSMGGNLGRLYAMDRVPALGPDPEVDLGYRRPDNLCVGDFHKLVTVNTPHWGSEIAAITVTADNEAVSDAAFYIELLARVAGQDQLIDACDFDVESVWPNEVTAGAVRDLRPDSRIIARMHMAPSPVPSHAIVGYTNVDSSGHCYAERTRRVLSIGCPGNSVFDFFGGNSDGVVGFFSQTGGLTNSDHVSVIAADLGLHWPTIGEVGPDSEPIGVAVELLNASARTNMPGARFASEFGSSYTVAPPPECGWTIEGLGPWAVETIPDKLYNYFLVTINPLAADASRGGADPLSVTFVSSAGQIVEVAAAPFEATMQIPPGWAGELRVDAIVEEAGGNRTLAQRATIVVPVPEGLMELSFPGFEEGRGAGQAIELTAESPERRVRVRGRFADGSLRALSVPGVGLAYSTADPRIATVDAEGVARGVRAGETTLTVEYAGVQATLPIRALSARGDSDGNGTVDYFDTLAFDRAASGQSLDPEADLSVFDFDGDRDIDCDDWAAMKTLVQGPPYVIPTSIVCDGASVIPSFESTGDLSRTPRFVDMSSDGRVILGRYRYSSTQLDVGFIWPLGADPVLLAPPTSLSRPIAISANGQWALGRLDSDLVRWSLRDGSYMRLAAPAGFSVSSIGFVSDSGDRILVSRSVGQDTAIWTPDSGWIVQQIPETPGTRMLTGATADAWTVVGWRIGDLIEGFRWSPNAGTETLAAPPNTIGLFGGFSPIPKNPSISDSGDVITGSAAFQTTSGSPMFLVIRQESNLPWSVRYSPVIAGADVSLAAVSGDSRFVAINQNGSQPVVVGPAGSFFYVDQQALIIWNSTYQNYDTPGNGVVAISNNGEVIVIERAPTLSPPTMLRISPPIDVFPCVEDIDGSGFIDFQDLNTLISNWGQTWLISPPGDTDFDRDVDFADLNRLISRFNEACP